MLRYVTVLMALAIVAVPASAQAATEAANVTITKVGFVPASVTISPGDAVTWTNTDTADHQLVIHWRCSHCRQYVYVVKSLADCWRDWRNHSPFARFSSLSNCADHRRV